MPKGDNNRKLSDEQRKEIAERYLAPLPDGTWAGCKIIARLYGVTDTLIQHVLKKQGITLRNAKEAHAHGKRCKPIKNLPPEGEAAPLCKCGCDSPVLWHQRANKWNVYVEGHYRQDASYKNEEWLREQYLNNHRSMKDIGAECGVTLDSIRKVMRKFGIPRRDLVASHTGTQAGPKNPAWKGGVTPERQRLYKSGKWKEIVKELYKRDNYTCRRCGSPKKTARGLHAHHVKPWADAPELRLDFDNLLTLCNKCHTWVHSRENVKKELLA